MLIIPSDCDRDGIESAPIFAHTLVRYNMSRADRKSHRPALPARISVFLKRREKQDFFQDKTYAYVLIQDIFRILDSK